MKIGRGTTGGKGGRGTAQLLAEAVAAHQAGKFFKARKLYEAIIDEEQTNVPALHYFGILEAQQQNATKALRLLDRALTLVPNAADILADKGKVLADVGQHEEALHCFQQSVSINPEHWMALQNQGASLLALQRPAEALSVFDRLLVVKRDYPPAFNNRGLALRDLDRYEEAAASFKQALALNPRDVEVWTNLGDGLLKIGNYDEAAAAYDKALAIKPDLAQAWLGHANVFCERRRYEEAVAAYDKTIALKPDLAEAWFGRGNVLCDHKRYVEALADYEKVLSLKPNFIGAEGSRLQVKMYICDWANRDSECARVISSIRGGKAGIAPFTFLGISLSVEDQFQCAKSWAADKFPSVRNPVWRGERYSHEKIRIAYMSADFYEHPVSFLMAEMFELHDRARFDVTAISLGASDGSPLRQRLEESFDRFVDAQSFNENQISDLVRSLEVDILIDLMGFTGISRAGVFARRVAPIQVNYLGYAGTMGAEYFDYILADRTVIPEKDRPFYSEKIACLPNTFMVNDSKRKISEHVPSRAECGLPEDGFVFCSFNQNYKLAPDVFDVWMRLLRQVEGSVLWLSKANEAAVSNLKREAQNRGVNPDRLVFASRVRLNEDHLARHKLADLFLDTLPFNAHSTASDSLWAGLPVLTQIGETFAGRVAASLLNAVGVPELITRTRDEYENVALELATHPAKLALIKDKLSQNRLTTPLFDTELFMRHIQSAYEAMYERYKAGLSPDHIYVPDLRNSLPQSGAA
jgi:protein O-GlcNAc transferase